MDAIPFDIRAAGIRERVALQGFMHLVGAQIDELAPGSSTISSPSGSEGTDDSRRRTS